MQLHKIYPTYKILNLCITSLTEMKYKIFILKHKLLSSTVNYQLTIDICTHKYLPSGMQNHTDNQNNNKQMIHEHLRLLLFDLEL